MSSANVSLGKRRKNKKKKTKKENQRRGQERRKDLVEVIFPFY